MLLRLLFDILPILKEQGFALTVSNQVSIEFQLRTARYLGEIPCAANKIERHAAPIDDRGIVRLGGEERCCRIDNLERGSSSHLIAIEPKRIGVGGCSIPGEGGAKARAPASSEGEGGESVGKVPHRGNSIASDGGTASASEYALKIRDRHPER